MIGVWAVWSVVGPPADPLTSCGPDGPPPALEGAVVVEPVAAASPGGVADIRWQSPSGTTTSTGTSSVVSCWTGGGWRDVWLTSGGSGSSSRPLALLDLQTPRTLELATSDAARVAIHESAESGRYRTLIFGEICPTDPDGVCEDVTIEARFTVE